MTKIILFLVMLVAVTKSFALSHDYHCVDMNPGALSWTRDIFIEADPTEISVSVDSKQLIFTNSAGLTYHLGGPADMTSQIIFGSPTAESPQHTKGLHAWVAKSLTNGSTNEGRIYIKRGPNTPIKYVTYKCTTI